jgi:hypothetical protein
MAMKKITLLLIILSQISFARAQWKEVYVPQSNSIFGLKGGIYFSKDSVAVFDLGQNYLSVNGGYAYQVWDQRPLGDPYSIQALGNNQIRCSGGSYTIAASNTNGNSWFPIFVHNGIDTAFKNNRMLMGHFFNDQQAIVMGQVKDGCYEVWTSNNGGGIWTKLPCTNIVLPNYGNSMFLSYKTLYNFNGTAIFQSTSNENSNKLMRVSNYGLTIDSIMLPQGKILQSISFLNANEGLALMNDSGITDPNTLYKVSGACQDFTPYTPTDMLTKPVGIKTLKKTDNKTIYMVYGLDGMYYSNSTVSQWYQLDGNKHLDLVCFDELHFTSFMSETGNTNRLRVFESELTGNPSIEIPSISYIQNPVKDFIQFPENTSSYTLSMLNGQTVLSEVIILDNQPVSIAQIPKGLYILSLNNKKGNTTFHKIILSDEAH